MKGKVHLNICFIADANHINTWNWVEYFANNLKHDVSIISFNKPPRKLKNVELFNIGGFFSKTKLRYLFCIPQIRKVLKLLRPDLLIGYRVHSYGFAAAMTGFHPLVLAAQGQNVFYPFNSPIAKLCAKVAIRRADLINSWEKHMTDKFLELGCPPEKILTIPRGVRIDVFHPHKIDRSGIINLISTRSLKEHYQLDIVIKGFKIVRDNGQKVRLTLAGDGPYRKNLEQIAKNLGFESEIVLLGSIGNEQLPEFLRLADIYISMVRTDGVSASLLEAMACGVFPIVTDNVANRIWIDDGINGFLVPERNERILAEKILLAISQDSLREKAAKINRSIVEQKGNWEKNMKTIERAYLKLVNGSLSYA